jgi:hypothetical protein
MKITEELSNAYYATKYLVYRNDGKKLILFASGTSEDVKDFLESHQAKTCAFITAYNPESKMLSNSENLRRQMDLICSVGGKWVFYPGEGINDKGDWPAEKSILILDISLEQAREIALKFEQTAFLFGDNLGKTELIATDPEEQNNLKHPLQRAGEELDKILNATPFTEEDISDSKQVRVNFIPRRNNITTKPG